jgi:EAL domain-containing protein (putative c-di-GMP-specific phosphodiesterase class I)
MYNTEFALERLNQLRALGVTIAIDDFGTGFSSLAYITRFPIDTLKIDRSFIAKVGESVSDAAVAQAIVALARSLKVRVVAEGVETAEQLTFLRDRCCDAAQGYLLGPPMPPEFFSVQGFHFAAACSAEDFGKSFGNLAETSGNLVRATVH